ncbi:MAG: heme-binding protein [Alphaproteobacteria bacterium]|nr:heme-binding protein [Alphaproteobacteria bacterium]
MTTISLAQAEIMINAIFKEARRSNNKPMAVAVTDQGGSVIVFKKEDDSSMMRFEMAHGKCFASLAMGRSSSLVRYRAEQRPMFMDYLLKASDNKIFAEDGGMLVREQDGALLGAIGVTGERPERDEELAVIAIHKAKFLTDEDAVGTSHNIRTEN